MGWNFRKSVNLGGGMRLNFSKSGIGISGGVKGFRVSKGPRGTRLTASIPGTGLYYTKNLSGGRRRNGGRRGGTTSPAYPYTQVVTNDYTGETRELRARTRYELDQLVQVERDRQAVNEARQKQLKAAADKRQQVETMNRQLEESRQSLLSVIAHTLTVDDRIDWDKEMIGGKYPEFNFSEMPPKPFKNDKIGFFQSLLMFESRYEIKENSEELAAYDARRNAAIRDYMAKKTAFEREQNKNNGEMIYLRDMFEKGEKDAVERYISIVLTKSEYPADLEHDFDIIYDKESKTAIVNFLFQDIDSFPVIEQYVYHPRKDEIEEKLMKKGDALTLYTSVLYSVGVRTIHEIFESVYTGSVRKVCFNGYIQDEEESACEFAMRAEKDVFERIDLTLKLDDILSRIETRAVKDMTKNDEVEPFED